MNDEISCFIWGSMLFAWGYLTLYIMRSSVNIMTKGYLLCGLSLIGLVFGLIISKITFNSGSGK